MSFRLIYGMALKELWEVVEQTVISVNLLNLIFMGRFVKLISLWDTKFAKCINMIFRGTLHTFQLHEFSAFSQVFESGTFHFLIVAHLLFSFLLYYTRYNIHPTYIFEIEKMKKMWRDTISSLQKFAVVKFNYWSEQWINSQDTSLLYRCFSISGKTTNVTCGVVIKYYYGELLYDCPITVWF